MDANEKIKASLKIWLNTADSVIEQLKFLARVYEVEEYEEEADEEIEEFQ